MGDEIQEFVFGGKADFELRRVDVDIDQCRIGADFQNDERIPANDQAFFIGSKHGIRDSMVFDYAFVHDDGDLQFVCPGDIEVRSETAHLEIADGFIEGKHVLRDFQTVNLRDCFQEIAITVCLKQYPVIVCQFEGDVRARERDFADIIGDVAQFLGLGLKILEPCGGVEKEVTDGYFRSPGQAMTASLTKAPPFSE